MVKIKKSFQLEESVVSDFDDWVLARPWLKKGEVVEALLRLALQANDAVLMAILQGVYQFRAEAQEPQVSDKDALAGTRQVHQRDQARKPKGTRAKRKSAGGGGGA